MSYKDYFLVSVMETNDKIKELNRKLEIVKETLKEKHKEFNNLTKLCGVDNDDIYENIYNLVVEKDNLILEREDIKNDIKKLKRKLRNMRYYKKLKDEVVKKEIEDYEDMEYLKFIGLKI